MMNDLSRDLRMGLGNDFKTEVQGLRKDMAKETVVVRDMKGKRGGERDKRKECEVVRDIKGESGSERHRDIKGKSVRW